jgi:hypothetical protein
MEQLYTCYSAIAVAIGVYLRAGKSSSAKLSITVFACNVSAFKGGEIKL